MTKLVKTVHLIAMAVFVGSIPGHIVLGALGDPAEDLAAFAAYHAAKHALTLALTVSGLALVIVSGLVLAGLQRGLLKRRWLQVKIVLVALITLNAAVFLVPLSGAMAALARDAVTQGTLAPAFAGLAAREAVSGAANLVMIVAVIALAVFRPGRRTAQARTASPP